MGNYCSNSIMIISTEQGIRDFLWWMIKNLENAGLFDPKDEPDSDATSRDLHKLVKPYGQGLDYLATLGATGNLGSDDGSFSLSQYDDGTYYLEQGFSTKNGPASYSLRDVQTAEPWVAVRGESDEYSSWDGIAREVETSSNHDDGSLSNEDYALGYPYRYFAIFYRVAGYGEFPPNPEKIKYLLKKKRFDEILAQEDDPVVREACSHVSPIPFFKKNKFDAYITLLKMSDKQYRPAKVDEYLEKFIDKKRDDALSAFIEYYAWNQKTAKLAREFLAAKKGGEKALTLLEAKLQECGL